MGCFLLDPYCLDKKGITPKAFQDHPRGQAVLAKNTPKVCIKCANKQYHGQYSTMLTSMYNKHFPQHS